jgi:hypothetical protein
VALVAEIVEGETRRLTFGLRADGEIFILTGYTVSDIILTGADGAPVDTSGDFGLVSASQGTVYYDPDAADFVAIKSPYRVRVKVTEDSTSKVRYFPNTVPDTIKVNPLR